jgi:hypothetical protein
MKFLTNLEFYFDGQFNGAYIYPAVMRMCRNTICMQIRPLFWHTRYHHRFPREFKDMVLALVLCNKRVTCMPYLPLEMIWAVLETVQYF